MEIGSTDAFLKNTGGGRRGRGGAQKTIFGVLRNLFLFQLYFGFVFVLSFVFVSLFCLYLLVLCRFLVFASIKCVFCMLRRPPRSIDFSQSCLRLERKQTAHPPLRHSVRPRCCGLPVLFCVLSGCGRASLSHHGRPLSNPFFGGGGPTQAGTPRRRRLGGW